MVSAVIQMFIAGFDTTSSILSVTLCCLATNQEAQEKLYKEIMDTFESVENLEEEELDYTKIQVFSNFVLSVLIQGNTRKNMRSLYRKDSQSFFTCCI